MKENIVKFFECFWGEGAIDYVYDKELTDEKLFNLIEEAWNKQTIYKKFPKYMLAIKEKIKNPDYVFQKKLKEYPFFMLHGYIKEKIFDFEAYNLKKRKDYYERNKDALREQRRAVAKWEKEQKEKKQIINILIEAGREDLCKYIK